jgi:hypothetical protein
VSSLALLCFGPSFAGVAMGGLSVGLSILVESSRSSKNRRTVIEHHGMAGR